MPFLFDTVRIWEFSLVDFDKCYNLSKRNVKLILKILSDLEPLRDSSHKKTLHSTRSCVNWANERFKLAHSCQKRPNLHTNSLNKLHTTVWATSTDWVGNKFWWFLVTFMSCSNEKTILLINDHKNQEF
jgi:hypothetical protein